MLEFLFKETVVLDILVFKTPDYVELGWVDWIFANEDSSKQTFLG